MQSSINGLCLLLAVLIFASCTPAAAKTKLLERDYQDTWCSRENGQVEYVLPDRARVDCLTETHAIEFDFGKKWAEAIGQSLYYSAVTGKRPGIVLIVDNDKDQVYLDRIRSTIKAYSLPIDLWTMTKE